MGAENQQSEPESKTRLRLWIKILRFARESESTLRENLRTTFDTTLPRFDVLAMLYQFKNGLKMSELSDHLLVSNGSATVVVDRLVKEGLVIRKSVPGDRRALQVLLTKKGKQHFLEQAKEHEEWVDQLLGGVSMNQAQMLMKILESNRRKLNKK